VLVPYAICVALAASLVITRTANGGYSNVNQARLASGLLLLFSLLTYQTAGMFFVIGGVVVFLGHSLCAKEQTRVLRDHAVVGATTFAVAFGTFVLSARAFQSPITGTPRAGVVEDASAKLSWFVASVLPQSLSFWDMRVRPATGAVAIAIIISGLWLLARERRRPFVTLAVAVAAIPAAYLPSLVSAENWPSYRSQLALSSLLLLYLLIAAKAHARFLRFDTRTWVSGTLAVIGIPLAIWGSVACFALPQSRELDIVRSHFTDSTFPKHLVVRASTSRESLAPIVRHDEFGMPSSATAWGATALPYVVIRELYPGRDTTSIRVIRAQPGQAIDLDLGDLLRGTRLRAH
jgi:hypothetical protein